MPFLDWVNKNQAVAGVKGVPYHLLKREQECSEERAVLVPDYSEIQRAPFNGA